MASTIADIRTIIEEGKIEPEIKNVVCEGSLQNSKSEKENYLVCNGSDFIRANQCDTLWGTYNLEILKFIKSQKYSEKEIDKISEEIQLDDSHWDWLAKSCKFKSDEYEWFFLVINNQPQAACLIYHPKKSVIDTGDIFYIEYVAVAPWNRNNPMKPKQFNGAGQEIIKSVIKFATQKLKLRFGFSLHSLPKAEGFYRYIGMTHIAAHDKDSLNYYEMTEENAEQYVGTE